MQRSAQLSEKMVDILTSFESRLGRLQQTILPIYNDMENLQLKKTSMIYQYEILLTQYYDFNFDKLKF